VFNPSTQEAEAGESQVQLRQEDHEYKASLGYVVRPYLK
jgi:hypothetical protein